MRAVACIRFCAFVHGVSALIRVLLPNLTAIARMPMTKTPARGMPSIGNASIERTAGEVVDEFRSEGPSPMNIE